MIVDSLNQLSSSDALMFTRAVGFLNDSENLTVVGTNRGMCYVLNTQISLDSNPSVLVPLRVNVFADWNRFPPQIFCDEKWNTRELDWHVVEDGSFCWDHPIRWVDRCVIAKEILPLLNYYCHLAAHLRDSIQSLLNCHWWGAERGLDQWHTSWPQFSHHESGTREYILEQDGFKKALQMQLMREITPPMIANKS